MVDVLRSSDESKDGGAERELAVRRLAALLAAWEEELYSGEPVGLSDGWIDEVDLDAHAELLDEMPKVNRGLWRRGRYERLARAVLAVMSAPASTPRAVAAKRTDWGDRRPGVVVNFDSARHRILARRAGGGR